MMKQMHANDNDADHEALPPNARNDSPQGLTNGSEAKRFTITCGRCGGWTAVGEYEDEAQCARCGAPIGQESEIVVNFRPGMTPPVRWVGRIVLAAFGLMAILTIWVLMFNRK